MFHGNTLFPRTDKIPSGGVPARAGWVCDALGKTDYTGSNSFLDKKVSRPTFEDFKQKALANPEVKQAYDALSTIYTLRKRLMRKSNNEGLIQQVAEVKVK
jgi:hypothetical protein